MVAGLLPLHPPARVIGGQGAWLGQAETADARDDSRVSERPLVAVGDILTKPLIRADLPHKTAPAT